jgi:hypothetical protein
MSIISSLLQKVSSLQIEDLIIENNLAKEGYKFYYAIDNHDIHQYCFPGDFSGDKFEQDEQTNEINYDLETDRITAYDEFFKSLSEDNPVFFLNEYILELKDMKAELERRIMRGPLFNYATEFNAYLEEIKPDKNQIILEDFTLYIAIATGFIKNGAQRFNEIVKNPFFIYRSEQFDNIKNGRELLNVFIESHHSPANNTDRIFDLFMKLSKLGNRFSKRTDSEAIDRICRINQVAMQNGPSKTLILFLSTSKVTRDVAQHFQVFMPKVKFQPFNFHRTVEQLFIKRLLQDLDFDARHDRLEKCKQIITNRENLDKFRIDDWNYDWEKIFTENLKTIREKYVNTNLARKDQFQKIRELAEDLEKASKNMNLIKLKKLYSNLQTVAKRYTNELENINDIKIVETKFQLDQTFVPIFKKAIDKLKQGHPMKISRGKDFISGTGQHLPILFFYRSEKNAALTDQIAELYLSKLAFLHPSGTLELTRKIIDIASSIYDSIFDIRSLHDKLVLCLYMLILPEINHEGKTNNEVVEEFLQEIRHLDLTKLDDVLYSDLLYVLCWVLRRNTKYKEAMEITEKALDLFPKDPRFYHSRFLITICIQSSNPNDRATKSYFKSLLEDICKAADLYRERIDDRPDSIWTNILATLLNSEIYTEILSLRGNLDDSETRPILEKIMIEKLPRLKKIIGEQYEVYPEFLHTEAYFELLMSQNTSDPLEKAEWRDKSISTLRKAIEVGNKLVNYDTKSYSRLLETLETTPIK